ncbi:MAG: ABC transporter permease, partial [Anaerolineae bacterium]
TWLVARREFRQRVRARGFLLTSIGTPSMLLVVWVLAGTFGGTSEQPLEELARANRPDHAVGYVDLAGLIHMIPDPIPTDLFQALPDVEAAEVALERGDIGAYYVIPSDYQETGDVRRVSPHLPTMPPDVERFNWILVSNLFPDTSPEQIVRLRWPFNSTGPEFVPLSPEGEAGAEGEGNVWLPFLVAAAVMVPLFTSGSYLLQSLAQEKGTRVMEILLVSLQPHELLTGKLLGLGTLTLVQYACWAAISWLGLVITRRDASQILSGISLSSDELLLVVPYALGGFVLYAALMAGIGALAPDIESSRAWVFVVTLPIMVPIYLWMAITTSPNGPLATALSLIPFSAPVAMLMRMTSTTVPPWQLGVSLILLVFTGVGMIRLIARLFRVQTLLSGESLSVRRVWSALRAGTAANGS